MRRSFRVAKAVKVVMIIAVVLAVLGFVTMRLWNWLVPALFTGPTVGYWQALGLLLLARLLFGGLRHHHGPGGFGPWGRHHGWHQWRERWEQMTPEEQEQLRARFRGRWREGWNRCGGPEPAAEPRT